MSDVLVVTGAGRVADAFRRLAGLVVDQEGPLDEWAERVEQDADQLVPVDTGALAATLTASSSGDLAYVAAGAGLDYAHLVDPFLKRSAGEHDPRVLDLVEDNIGSLIRRVGLG